MTSVAKIVISSVVVMGLAFPNIAAAQQSQDQNPTVEEQLSEAEKQLEAAVQMMLLALRGIIASIPQYQMPEVLDNGDIVIRRAPPAGSPAPEPEKKDGDGGMKL